MRREGDSVWRRQFTSLRMGQPFGILAGRMGCGIDSGSKSWEMSGASPWTTISEMELLAAVEALHSVPAGRWLNCARTQNS